MSKLSMVGTSLAVSGIVIGSIVWNGAETLESAKTWINQASSKIELFQSNESKMKSALESKNAEIAELKTQLRDLSTDSEGNAELIAELQAELATLKAEKEEIEAQLAEKTEREDSLVNEIDRLNQELTKANADAEALQVALDNAVNIEEVEVTDQTEIDQLVEEVTIPMATVYETFAVGAFDYDSFKITVRVNGNGHEVDFTNKMDDTLTLTLYSEAEGGKELNRTVNAGETVDNVYIGIGLTRKELYKIEVKDSEGNLLFIME